MSHEPMCRFLASVLTATLLSACGPSPATAPAGGTRMLPGAQRTIRYRLPLRDNPEDPVEARHCYNECRTEKTQAAFVECLSECPGFEVVEGEVCRSGDGPPRSACVTALLLPPEREGDPGAQIVLGVLVGTLIIVGTAAACGASSPPGCVVWPAATWPKVPGAGTWSPATGAGGL